MINSSPSSSSIDFANLFTNLSKVIYTNTKEIKKFVTYKNDTKIIFHSINPINAQNITLNVGKTADGNNREPILNLQLEEVKKIIINSLFYCINYS